MHCLLSPRRGISCGPGTVTEPHQRPENLSHGHDEGEDLTFVSGRFAFS